MDPVTLTPKTVNPWRNPMKTGIVSPAYDSTALASWKYGFDLTNGHASNAPTNPITAETDRGALAAAAGDSWIILQRWDVTAGVKSITAWEMFALDYVPANISAAYIVVYKDDTTVYTKVAESVAIAAGDGADAWKYYTGTLATPLSVTLGSGSYYYGIRFVLAGTNTDIALMRSDGADWTYPSRRTYVKAANYTGVSIPAADVASEAEITAHDSAIGISIAYTSSTFIEFSKTNWAAYYKWFIPVAADDRYIIKLTDLVVSDTKRFEIWQQDTNRQGVAATTMSTKLDCGKAAAGTNAILVNDDSIELADITATGVEGKKFHILLCRRPVVNGSASSVQAVLWSCAELEGSYHNHSIKFNNARTSTALSFTTLRGRVLKVMDSVAGAGCSVGNIQVGIRPVVTIGDSQTHTSLVGGARPSTAGWGPMWSYFAKPRIWINGGVAGGLASALMESYIASATPGGADLESIVENGCLWLWCGYGVNDISADTPSTDAESKKLVATLVDYITDLYQVLNAYGHEDMLFCGLPPYSDGDANEYDGRGVRWFNRAMLGLCMAWKLPFYNAWPDMVTPGTQGDTIPSISATYSADGLHMNAAASAVVCAKAAAAVENATIDLRDAWD
jgi:lysophospholipase L1-like esterase